MSPRVLVVDDERLIRWSLEQMLEKGGYTVETAEDGATALAAVRDESPDLVLLDLKLPDADGIQVIRQIKEVHPDTICLGYDQKVFVDRLGGKLKEFGLTPKIVRIMAFKPEAYKSSIMKQRTSRPILLPSKRLV